MTLVDLIRNIIFWLSIAYIISSLLVLTLGQSLPIELSDKKLQSDYYNFVFIALPFSILLTLIRTIRQKYPKAKNRKITVFTSLMAGLCIFILFNLMFSIGFGSWTNETILFRNKRDHNITIAQQIFDVGALGYGGRRTAELTPFLKYFQLIKQVDTSNIDKAQWIFVNEEANLHFP
jgi:hypothetical protein